MKVIFVTEFFPSSEEIDVQGGVEMRTWYLAQGLGTQHDVEIVCVRQPGQTVESTVGRVRVVRVGPVGEYRQGGGLLSRWLFFRSARQYLLRNAADLILAENFAGYTVGLTLPSRLQRRTILTYHDVWRGAWIKNVGLVWGIIGEVVEFLIFRRPWLKFICNSHATKVKVMAQGVPAGQVVVIPNAVDTRRIQSLPTENFSQPTVVTVARLVLYKRLDDLLHAFRLVQSARPNTQLVVIGSGPEEQRLKSLAQDLGLDANVEWRGFVDRHDAVVAAIKGATVFSLPSAVEGFGITTLEAMAAGTPYVNSDISPTKEVTGEGQGGILYPLGDRQALAAGLQRIIDHPETRQRLSLAGQSRAQHYELSAVVKQMRNLVNTVFLTG